MGKLTKIISCIILLLFFLGCSSSVKLEQPDTFEKFEINKVGDNRSIVVAKIFNYRDERIITQQIAESVLSSELALSGFNVLERTNFKYIVDEHIFSDKVAIRRLLSEFSGADFIAILTLTKINIYSDNDLYLIYNNFKTVCDIRVDLKIIDTRTAQVYSSYGEGKASISQKNFVLVLGQHNSNTIGLYEDAYRLALRQAISRIQLR